MIELFIFGMLMGGFLMMAISYLVWYAFINGLNNLHKEKFEAKREPKGHLYYDEDTGDLLLKK